MDFEKIKKFIFDNYKLLIPISLLLVVFLSFIIYYLVSKTFVFSKTSIGSYYQYFGVDDKLIYDVEVTVDKKGVIKNIKAVDRYFEYDSTPLYSSSSDRVIFPKDMSVVAPIVNCSEYLAKANSYIEFKNKRYSLVTEKYNSYLGHYFLYDGDDLYFFIEDVTLNVNGEEILLGPFSYVIANNKKLSYYVRDKGEYVTVDLEDLDSYVINDYYKVYLNGDYIDYYGQRVILSSDLSYLSTIDEMKRVTEY